MRPIRIGWSYGLGSGGRPALLSRAIMAVSGAPCSHTFLVVDSPTFGCDMVLEADKGGVQELPLATFRKANKILRLEVDSSAPTGSYYIHVLQGTQGAVPPNGALPAGVTFLRAPRHVNHVSGVSDTIPMEENTGENGIAFEGGCTVLLSTTQATITIAGALMLVDADVR